MSPLKTSLKKKRVIDYHRSKLLGVMFKVPPDFGHHPIPKNTTENQVTEKQFLFAMAPFFACGCCGLRNAPTEPPSKDGKKKRLHAQVGISKWSKILLATAAYYNLDFCKSVSIICLDKNIYTILCRQTSSA